MKLQLKNSSALTGATSIEPSATQMLDGELAINYNSTDPRLYIKESDGTIGQVPIVRSKEQLTINSNGFIGLGTTSPQTVVDLRSDDPKIRITDLSTSALHILDADSSVGNLTIEIDNTSASSASDLILKSRGTEKLRIKGVSGRLGIGTNDPQEMLHISAGGNSSIRLGVSSGEFAYRLRANVSSSVNGGFLIEDADSGTDLYKVVSGSAGYHQISVNGVERCRVTSNGLTFLGDTAAVNALSDYEEGTFTPTYVTGQGSINPVYDQQTGVYTKIGNMVHFRLRLRTDSLNASSAGGNVDIAGLPFTSGASSYTAVSIFSLGWNSQVNPYQAFVFNAGNTIALYHQNTTVGSNPGRIQFGDLNTTANDNNTYIAGCYTTD